MVMLFELTYFDVTMIIIVMTSSLYGVSRGFFSESLSLLTWIFVFLASFNLDKIFYPFAFSFIQSEMMRVWVLRLVIAIAILILGNVSKKFLTTIVKKNFPGNMVFGFFFGLLRSLLFIAIIIAIIQDSFIYDQAWIKESIFLEAAESVLDTFMYIFLRNA